MCISFQLKEIKRLNYEKNIDIINKKEKETKEK